MMQQFRNNHSPLLVSVSGDRLLLALSGEGGAGVEMRLTLAQAEQLLAVLAEQVEALREEQQATQPSYGSRTCERCGIHFTARRKYQHRCDVCHELSYDEDEERWHGL